jgi:precorrin-2 dehydrogenase/sirohydrochlorin ferrochelatase
LGLQEACTVLPLIIDPKTTRIGLAGEGEGLRRRLDVLEAAGVAPVTVMPDDVLDGISVLFVAGFDVPTSEGLVRRARRQGILVNVEDVPELCDFNVPAIVRRGDLLLTVSTHGRAPGLARRLREWLEQRFGVEWEGRLVELGSARDGWRAQGLRASEIGERTRRLIDEKGWLA